MPSITSAARPLGPNLVRGAVGGLLSGVAFGVVVSRVRSDGVVAVLGAAYGAALFVVNFLVLAPVQFTPFEGANKPFELAVHVMFGSLLALALVRREGAVTDLRGDRRSVSVG